MEGFSSGPWHLPLSLPMLCPGQQGMGAWREGCEETQVGVKALGPGGGCGRTALPYLMNGKSDQRCHH